MHPAAQSTPPVSTLEIRPAATSDAPALATLLAELNFPTQPDAVRTRLADLNKSGDSILVAVSNGQVLGLAALHIMPLLHRPKPVGRVTALVVTASARRHGVGRALIQAAETELRRRGCGLLEITSNHRLTEAHAFYERLGFAITSHRFCKSLDP